MLIFFRMLLISSLHLFFFKHGRSSLQLLTETLIPWAVWWSVHVRPQVLLKWRLWEQVGQWWGLVEGRKAPLWRVVDGQAPREAVSSKMGGSWPGHSSLVSLGMEPLIQHTSCDLYIDSSLMLTSVWYCLMGELNEPTSSQGGSDPHRCTGMGKQTLVRLTVTHALFHAPVRSGMTRCKNMAAVKGANMRGCYGFV